MRLSLSDPETILKETKDVTVFFFLLSFIFFSSYLFIFFNFVDFRALPLLF